MAWVKKNLIKSDSIIIALTSYNDINSKENSFDFESFANSDLFSAVLIKDLNNTWYTGGIPGAGANFTEVVTFLREICQNYKRVMVIGDSMAGYGALLYGMHINADKIIALSPQTTVSYAENMMMGDTRFVNWFKLIRDFPEDAKNLREGMRNSGARSVDVFVSTNDRQDVPHARNLEGIEGVNVTYIDAFDHWMTSQFKRYGILREIVSSFLFDIKTDVRNSLARLNRIIKNVIQCEKYLASNGDLIAVFKLGNSFNLGNAINADKLGFKVNIVTFNGNYKRTTYHLKLNDMIRNARGGFFEFRVPLPSGANDSFIVSRQTLYNGDTTENIGVTDNVFTIQADSTGHQGARSDAVGMDDLTGQMTINPGEWENRICNDDFIMFSPYIAIDAGRYMARVYFNGRFDDGSRVTLDAAANHGAVFASRDYENMNGLAGYFCLPLCVHEKIADVEIRLRLSGRFNGTIDRVVLETLSSSPC